MPGKVKTAFNFEKYSAIKKGILDAYLLIEFGGVPAIYQMDDRWLSGVGTKIVSTPPPSKKKVEKK